MSTSKPVLILGGPEDGKVYAVKPHQSVIEFAQAPELTPVFWRDAAERPEEALEFKRLAFRIDTLALFRHPVHIAVEMGTPDYARDEMAADKLLSPLAKELLAKEPTR